MIFKLLLAILTTTLFEGSNAIIGFDCSSAPPNITTISLLDTAECDFHDETINSTQVQIQLLQIAEFRSVHVIQCKVEIRRTVFQCSIFDYLIPTPNGEQEYLYDISRDNCKKIHETGIFQYGYTHTIADLSLNDTKTTGIDFAGNADGKSCTGAAYADKYGSWSKVFVQGTIKITLNDYYAQVSLKNDKIRLRSGTVCSFTDTHCIDMDAGHTFWDTIPFKNCFNNNYDVLYQGPAIKMFSSEKISKEVIYTVQTPEVTFALETRDYLNYCNQKLIRTEHPKLVIFENILSQYTNTISSEPIINLDLFTYINSKFVYIEKHFRKQMTDLYLDIIKQKCELERKTLQNSLSIATLAPDLFAYEIMKSPGYYAHLAGEVVHVLQCTPIDVKIIHTELCYKEIPVKKNNETWFITPITHILTNKGTQITCNQILPIYYKISETWVKFVPTPTIAQTPNILHPSKRVSWTYKSAGELATTGIYTDKDLNELQNYLMFPMEKDALLNTLARGMVNEPIEGGNLIENLFSTDIRKSLAASTLEIIRKKYYDFGVYSAGILMIIITIQSLFKLLDIVVHAYTLHALYGWSMYLLGAFFSSVTHLFITLARQKKEQNMEFFKKKSRIEHYEEPIELKEIVIENRLPLPVKKPHPLPILKAPSAPPPDIPRKITNQITIPPKQIRLFSLD